MQMFDVVNRCDIFMFELSMCLYNIKIHNCRIYIAITYTE